MTKSPKTSVDMQSSGQTLEESMSEIESLIQKMESATPTLQESLDSFTRGVTLIKHCQKMLEDAEQKVEILLQGQPEEKLIPYEVASESSLSK